MAVQFHDIAPLLLRRLNGAIEEDELLALQQWAKDSADKQALLRDVADPAYVAELVREISTAKAQSSAILRKNGFPVEEPATVQPVHRVHFLKTAWFRYAAAIILIFGTGAYLWTNYNTKPLSTTATITPPSSDILPGGQKAMLTLADGRTIILDSAKNGQLANEHGSDIIKRGGEIIYDAGQDRDEAVVYNTMSTPKGGQYQLTLPDGTKVWLNAASQITYPTRFIGNTREVKVEGEIYFDIKANKNQPFIVKTNSDEIKVLGTEFNVNNYPDEPQSKISLINGAVKVNEQLLQPGQAFANGKIITTNIEQDVAWRNGYFYFVNADLPSVLRQIARWYDIDVKFAGPVPPRRFKGELSRSLTLSSVLNALRVMQIQYQLNGRTLTIQ